MACCGTGAVVPGQVVGCGDLPGHLSGQCECRTEALLQAGLRRAMGGPYPSAWDAAGALEAGACCASCASESPTDPFGRVLSGAIPTHPSPEATARRVLGGAAPPPPAGKEGGEPSPQLVRVASCDQILWTRVPDLDVDGNPVQVRTRVSPALAVVDTSQGPIVFLAVVDTSGRIWLNTRLVDESVSWDAGGILPAVWRYDGWGPWLGWRELPAPEDEVSFSPDIAPVLVESGLFFRRIFLFAAGTNGDLYQLTTPPRADSFDPATGWQNLTGGTQLAGRVAGPIAATRTGASFPPGTTHVAWGSPEGVDYLIVHGTLPPSRQEYPGVVAATCPLAPRLATNQPTEWATVALAVAVPGPGVWIEDPTESLREQRCEEGLGAQVPDVCRFGPRGDDCGLLPASARVLLFELDRDRPVFRIAADLAHVGSNYTGPCDVVRFVNEFHAVFQHHEPDGTSQVDHYVVRRGPLGAWQMVRRKGAAAGAGDVQPTLSVYRNKIVFLSTASSTRRVTATRWDNTVRARPDEPEWHMARPFDYLGAPQTLSGVATAVADWLDNPNPNMFAALTEHGSGRSGGAGPVWFICLSRSIFAQRLEDIGIPLRWYPRAEEIRRKRLPQGIRAWDPRCLPVASAIGYATWLLPEWLMEDMRDNFWRQLDPASRTPGTRVNDASYDHTAGDNAPRPDDQRAEQSRDGEEGMPVWLYSHADLNAASSTRTGVQMDPGPTSGTLTFFQELGHELFRHLRLSPSCPLAGAVTWGCGDPQGVSRVTIGVGSRIFGERTAEVMCEESGEDCPTIYCGLGPDTPGEDWPENPDLGGMCVRRRGFTGAHSPHGGCNYDCRTADHSFIHALTEFFYRGDRLRQMINEDMQPYEILGGRFTVSGDDLLLRKYWWISSFIFRTSAAPLALGEVAPLEPGWRAEGVEFQDDAEPCPLGWEWRWWRIPVLVNRCGNIVVG